MSRRKPEPIALGELYLVLFVGALVLGVTLGTFCSCAPAPEQATAPDTLAIGADVEAKPDTTLPYAPDGCVVDVLIIDPWKDEAPCDSVRADE